MARYGKARAGSIVRCAERNSAREIFHLSSVSWNPLLLHTKTKPDRSTARARGCPACLIGAATSSIHPPLPRFDSGSSTNSISPSAARDREGARDPQSRLCLLTCLEAPHQPYNNLPRGIESTHPSPSIRRILHKARTRTDRILHFGALREPHINKPSASHSRS
ncbi:hypothetical protein NA56DRAFT_33128 [Hyaloscypha hepaticicola]|uniref:Uncharacterized protein n=1 Tax=Hyaloscypha hepaticicola TaxID=2082293 RepID=A0A2J6QDE7_9HELO|nr:hypothetical protein NA56DRAFT_33128 [Hyaloscypha hepaticicola]